jgi:hypothetical protein
MGTGKTIVVCLSLVCLGSLRARDGAGADGASGMPVGAPHPGPVRIADRVMAAAVRSALDGAARRLERERCHGLFADFADAEGRSLQQNLEALGETGGSYMEKMLFYDAKGAGPCRRPKVLAFTEPGSRVVQVCGPAFQSAWRGERRLAEAVVIHETLHSLGLGENPPSTYEITARVLKLCQL